MRLVVVVMRVVWLPLVFADTVRLFPAMLKPIIHRVSPVPHLLGA